MRTSVFIILFIGLCLNANAQYLPLKPKGDLPKFFAGDYYTGGIKEHEINEDNLGFQKESYGEEYHMSGHKFLRGLALSGNVIWGDPVSNALQVEADKISSKFGFTRKPKVFLFRSGEVNAFATYGNYVFFTTALVARSNSFYELVYILGHEMAHLKNKDSYYRYIEVKHINKKLKRGPRMRTIFNMGKYDRLEDMEDNLSKHSKEREMKADKMGNEFFRALSYPSESSINALTNIEEAIKTPMYSFDFMGEDSVELKLPNLKLTEYDIRPLKKLQAEWSRSHPDWEDRYEQLNKLNEGVTSETFEKPEVDFAALKRIGTNETLYSFLLNNEYFKLIAFYHLGDKNHCDLKFLNYLYAQSLYVLLKLKIAFIEKRATYDPNKIMVEQGGPLQPWLDMAEPEDFKGPERPFIKYFKKMTVSDLWYETATAIVKSTEEADYFYYPFLLKDCAELHQGMKVRMGSNYNKGHLDEAYDQLAAAEQKVSSAYGKYSGKEESITILVPYILTSAKKNQFNTDMDEINREFYTLLETLAPSLGYPSKIVSYNNISTTEDLNLYNAQLRLLNRRYDMTFVKEYPCFDPDPSNNVLSEAGYIGIEGYDKGSEFFSSSASFENGRIESDTLIYNKGAGNKWKKWPKVISKYFADQEKEKAKNKKKD